MKAKLSFVRLFLLCSTGILGIGLFGLPTVAAQFASTFAWGYICAATAIAFVPMLLLAALGDDTVYTAAKRCMPRGADTIVLVYAFFYFCVSAFLFAYYAHTVAAWFLSGVPRFLISVFLIGVCLYTATKGTQDVSRLIGFVSVFAILSVVVMHVLMLLSGDIRNLMPVFEIPRPNTLPYGAAVLACFFAGGGAVGVCRAARRTKLTAALSAALFCGLVFVLATAGCMCVIGPVRTAADLSSAVLAMKNLNLSKMNFFQRGDLVFILTWSFLMLSAGTLLCHIPYVTAQAVFEKAGRGWLFCIFFAVYVLVSLFVPTQAAALWMLLGTVLALGVISLVLIPFLLLVLKRRRSE